MIPPASKKRVATALALAAAASAPSICSGQDWSVSAGLATRGEYTDNYFYTGDDPQWAFTASILPFVTAERRTENSELAAILAVGGNRVWGPSPVTNYWSGRAAVVGALRESRSTWTGDAAFVRSPSLQNTITPSGVFLALAYAETASLNGTWNYAVTERWSAGATAGGYNNRYDAVENNALFQSNRGYYAGGTAGYLYSDATQLRFSAVYSYYSSDLTNSDWVTATAGIVHRLSPQLTVSATVGGFWSSNDLAAGVTAADGSRNANGWLYGGSVDYAASESTRFFLGLTENLGPSATGVITKSDSAVASLNHRFSDRLLGRAGVGYSRTEYPAAASSMFNQNTLTAEVGASYRFAERWTIEGGYRYSQTQYNQNVSEPSSNAVFLSIAYNWPGSSFTGWLGTMTDAQSLPGAGPVPLTERAPTAPRTPGVPTGPAPAEPSPFDRLPLP